MRSTSLPGLDTSTYMIFIRPLRCSGPIQDSDSFRSTFGLSPQPHVSTLLSPRPDSVVHTSVDPHLLRSRSLSVLSGPLVSEGRPSLPRPPSQTSPPSRRGTLRVRQDRSDGSRHSRVSGSSTGPVFPVGESPLLRLPRTGARSPDA